MFDSYSLRPHGVYCRTYLVVAEKYNRWYDMEQIVVDELKDVLIAHEGLKLKPYHCTADKLTIGIGRNLEDVGITVNEAVYLLENDIRRVTKELDDRIPFWNNLSPNKQIVLASMAFQLGVNGLMQFKRMLAAAQLGDDKRVAREMRDSKWFRQTPNRANDLIDRWSK